MLLSFVRSACVAVLVSLGAVWGSLPAQAQKADFEPYRLQPGDTILVNVLEDPELDREVLILPDGTISLPVAGSLVAAGQTPVQLEASIRQGLRNNFVRPPSVTVSVREIATEDEDEDLNEVFVLGEVGSPGRFEYESDTPISVLQALSLAGGLGPFAATSRIQVRESRDGIEQLRLFDYESIEDGLISTSRDLDPLEDGAVIVVPERGLFE